MPKTLEPIPAGVAIVDDAFAITDFFRLRWQSLIDRFQQSPTVAGLPDLEFKAKTAAITTTTLFTVKSAGLYRVSYYLEKNIADGVSSSLQFTYGYTSQGAPKTEAQAALTTDTTTAEQSGSKVVYADANTDLTGAIAYASNTPNKMTYSAWMAVEQLA